MPAKSENTNVTLTNFFRILSEARRLAVVDFFVEQDSSVGLQELTNAVEEHDVVESDLKDSVYTTLYQNHLPKLAASAIINKDWQSERQGGHRIEPGPAFDRAAAIIAASRASLSNRPS